MSSASQLIFRGVSVVAVLAAALFAIYNLPASSPDPVVATATQDSAEIPTLRLSADEINFGQVKPGEAESAIITLTHAGSKASGTLVVDNLFLDELDSQRYSTNTSGPIKLSPGRSFDLVVGFEPNEFGLLPGRLILNHSGVSGVEVIDLNGEGFDINEPVMSAANPASYPFGKSTLEGFGNGKPTSLQFGPDGRLYVAYMDGLIKVFTIERNGSNDYDVTDTDTITLVKNILNHNDNGSKKASLKSRLVTGLVVVGTASEPVIYVHSSDPRIGGGHSGNTTGLDTNSGVLSRLTLTTNGWKKLDLVRGLPRSEENHHSNGLTIVGSKLYLAAGGNTNMGATSNNFAMLPEYALSAAILEIDLAQIGDTTYDLPTLNDEDRAGNKDSNDPFGGNRGKNQAMIVQGGPVQVYAPGFRNPYDIIVMQNGKMYSWDNGPNSGWGGAPNNCSNGRQEPGNTQHDALHLITGKGYYGGHPNPTRGSKQNKFNNSNPQSPVPNANSIECNYYGPGTNGNGKHNKNKSLVSLARSTNGLAEYTANNFSGDINGDLLATSWDNKLYRVSFKPSGALDDMNVLFSNVGSSPLDVTAVGDNGVFPGTIWVADLQGKDIVIYEPDDYNGDGGDGGGGDGVCVVTSGNGDADQDGFTNDDEIANGTDGCSAADVPADADADQISDLLDPDDDNDNIPDLDDPFALDVTNGAGTSLNVDYQWENDSPDPGFLARLGFSGLMTNGTDDYQSLYDLNEMTIIGAAGVVTIDSVPAGDPLKDKNTQQYGFQFGVNVSALSPVFRAHTRILAPFSGFVPKNHQSMGLFIGTGDQDNYLKLVIKNDIAQMFSEVEGQVYLEQKATESFVGADFVDLIIEVDPASAIATAYYQITTNGQTGAEVQVSSFDFPAAWLTGSTKLAVGIISTSVGAQPFPATWDFITVKPLNTIAVNTAPDVTIYAPGVVTVGVPVSLSASVTDDGLPDNTLNSTWSKVSGPGSVVFSDEFSVSGVATFSAAGSYVLELAASDGDQSSTATLELSVTDGLTPVTGNIIYRINAGGPALSDASGDWQSDASVQAWFNTGKTWKSSATVDVSGLSRAVPAQLFQTERFDKAGAPDLEWTLPVTPGQYTVNLYFSENYIGAMAVGGRVFDVNIEGQLISALDIFASVGGNTALMKSVSVQTDAVLNISTARGTQNPAIKAIEVIQSGVVVPPITPETNQAPVVNAGIDKSAIPGSTVELSGLVTDDDLPDGTLVNNWTMVSGPANVLFSSANNSVTSMVVPAAGIYVLRLTANDGALQGSDDVKITVADAPVVTNAAPVVLAGPDSSTTVTTAISLVGSVVDDGLPSAATTAKWSKQSGPAAVQFGDDTSPTTTGQFGAAGNYVLRLSASDTVLGSFDEISITVTETQVASSVVYRVNAGGPAISDSTGNWLADNDGSSFANTGRFYSSAAAIDTAATPGVPASLFQTERWDKRGDEPLHWKLPVTPGNYEVRLYFSEIYNGAWFSGGRTFDVDVEGQALDDLDVWSKAGPNTAWVEIFNVTADNEIDIVFNHGINNPAIKGIEVISGSGPVTPPVTPPVDPQNTAPSVDAGNDLGVSIDDSLLLNGAVTDDGLPDDTLDVSWSKSSGSGQVTFSSSDSTGTSVSFDSMGVYVLTLTASDGVLSASDDIQVTVTDLIDDPVTAEVAYRINAGGPAINDATGNWAADKNGSAYVNTGKIWSRNNAIDTAAVTGVPMSIFQTERYDQSGGEELSWKLPVDPGNYEVRLYFAEIWKGGMKAGKRVFDITVEGQAESAVDIYSEVGGNTALMKTFTVSNTDGLIDIEFGHVVENPAVKGIEVIKN